MKKKFRVLLIGGVGASQEKLAHILSGITEVDLVGIIDSGEEGVNRYLALKPDVIFVDMITDGFSGLETARWIKEQTPSIKIILLSSTFNKDFFRAIVTMGLDGYLIKDVTVQLIRDALNSLCGGQNYYVNKPSTD